MVQPIERRADSVNNVITSYSIHYTKLYERAAGSVLIVETSAHKRLAQISGLGDLSHASVVYSRDERYAYVFVITSYSIHYTKLYDSWGSG